MIKNNNTEIARIDYGKIINTYYNPRAQNDGPYHSAYRVYAGNKLVFPSTEELCPRYCLRIARIKEHNYDSSSRYTEHQTVVIRTSLPIYIREITFGEAPEDEDWRNTDILINPRITHTDMWKRIDTVLAFGLPFMERGAIEESYYKRPGTWAQLRDTYPPPAERDTTFIYFTISRAGDITDIQQYVRAYTPSVYRRRRNHSGVSGGASNLYHVYFEAYCAADERYDIDNETYSAMLRNSTNYSFTRCTYGMKQMPSFCNGEVFCPVDIYRVVTSGFTGNWMGNAQRGYTPFYQYYNGSLSYVDSNNFYADYDICNYHVLENNNPSYSSYEEWLQDIKQFEYNPKPPLYEIPFNAGSI